MFGKKYINIQYSIIGVRITLVCMGVYNSCVLELQCIN